MTILAKLPIKILLFCLGFIVYFSLWGIGADSQRDPNERWIVISSEKFPRETPWACELKGWKTVVVSEGDNLPSWPTSTCVALNQKNPDVNSYATSEFSWGSVSRRNIGYLFAISKGAKIIVDATLDKLSQIPILSENPIVSHAYPEVAVFNPVLTFFDKASLPFGYPLNGEHEKNVLKTFPKNSWTPLQQIIDPDLPQVSQVDSEIESITFKRTKSLALPIGTYSPLTSRGLLAFEPIFWALMIPLSPSNIYAENIRGYILQRLLWQIEGNLALVPNPAQAAPYAKSSTDASFEYLFHSHQMAALTQFLSNWNLGNRWDLHTLEDVFIRLFEDLLDAGFLTFQDYQLAKAWWMDLKTLGYRFPEFKNNWSSFPKISQVPSLPDLSPELLDPKNVEPRGALLQLIDEREKLSKELERKEFYHPNPVLKVVDEKTIFENVICFCVPVSLSKSSLLKFKEDSYSRIDDEVAPLLEFMANLVQDVKNPPKSKFKLFLGAEFGDPVFHTGPFQVVQKLLTMAANDRVEVVDPVIYPPNFNRIYQWNQILSKAQNSGCATMIPLDVSSHLNLDQLEKLVEPISLNNCKDMNYARHPSAGLGVTCYLSPSQDFCQTIAFSRRHYQIFNHFIPQLYDYDFRDWFVQVYKPFEMFFPLALSLAPDDDHISHSYHGKEVMNTHYYVRAAWPILANWLDSQNPRCKRHENVETLLRNLKTLTNMMEEINVPFVVMYGSLLGVVRGNALVEGDDDIDVYVDQKHWAKVLKKVALVGRVSTKADSVFAQMELSDKTVIDIYFYVEEGDKVLDYWNYFGLHYGDLNPIEIPKDYLLPLKRTKLDVIPIYLPNQPEKLVEYLYGSRWREKLRKRIDYQISIKDRKPFIEYLSH